MRPKTPGITVYVVTIELANGGTRRRVLMTRAGARRALERAHDDERAATMARARLVIQ